MNITVAFSPDKYYEDAQKMLEKKDLLEFVSKISIAVESSMNDPKMMAKATFLKAKGLMEFNQHTKAVESIDEALKYNDGVEAFELRKLRGTAKGFLGCVSEAITTYKELLSEATDNVAVVRICINLAWAYLTLDNKTMIKVALLKLKNIWI